MLAPELDDVDGVVSWKWVTQFELAELSAAAGVASSVDAGMELLAYTLLIGPAEAYGAVFELPEELVAALCGCSEREVESVARRWRALRGADAYPPWSAEDLTELVGELTALARKAADSGRRMFLHCGEP